MQTLSTTCEWTSGTQAAKPSRFRGLVTSIIHEVQIRRALREVGMLDETALHDIGIGPGGIEDAVRCGRR
jgi:uncharacterized protein YjiS (DUF1127 family)